MTRSYLILLAAALTWCSCTRHPRADLVVIGKIWTGNKNQPWAEAMAIVSDSIVAVGTVNEIQKWTGETTETIACEAGNLVVPGFIDCHTHFVDGGFRLSSVQLRDAKTPVEFIQRLKAFAKTLPAGTWITGGDWDHENWGGELPQRQWIDSVTRNNPVWINRLDGHMALANTAALSASKVDDKVKAVAGGAIIRDRTGRLTGIFKDNAQQLIENHLPPPSAEQEDRALQAAMEYVASKGVTSVHSMSGYTDVMERFRKDNKLTTRIYAGRSISDWKEVVEKMKVNGRGDKWLESGCVKEFMDGSLGSHTAAFFKSFSDAPGDSGFLVNTVEELHRLIHSADSAHLQVMVHAIGDRAIHTLLAIFERVEKEDGPADRRFRIEHAQHIYPNDFKRFAELGVIASMQPYHCIDDGRWAEKVIGLERSKSTYAFRSVLDAGAILVFGSDWFVAPPTPLEGIYAAVTRRTLDDKNPGGWIPEQKISVEEALQAYTRQAAYASFDEKIKGSLEPGKLADFVILERDITLIPPEEIRKVSVLRTVVGGKSVFKK